MRAIFTNRAIYLVADTQADVRPAEKFAGAMSFLIEGAFFSEAYREGHWDGRERLVRRLRGNDPAPYMLPDEIAACGAPPPPGVGVWFAPVGLGENVLDFWLHDLKVIDARPPLRGVHPLCMDRKVIPTPRPYQVAAKNAILFADGVLTGKGLIRLPTRAGKTVIAAEVICELGVRSLFLVNSDMLLTQTFAFFDKVILSAAPPEDENLTLVGKWGGGVREPGWVTVASVQSLVTHVQGAEKVFKSERARLVKALGSLARKRFSSDDEADKKARQAVASVRPRVSSATWTTRGGKILDPKVARDPVGFERLEHVRKAALELLHSADAVFFDECHHLTSDEWRGLLEECRARYKIGLSATIYFDHEEGTPKENVVIMAATGPVVHALTPSELIEQGWLCRPEIHLLEAPEPVEPPPIAEAYTAIYRWGIVENGPRNDRIVEIVRRCISRGERVLVTVMQVKHAKILKKLFEAAGMSPGVVTGETPNSRREQIVADVKSCKLDVLIGTVFKEAVDLPFLETVVIGGGMASKVLTMQRLRNLTPVDEHDRVIQEPMKPARVVDVYDFMDRCHRFLRDHSNKRRDEYRSHEAFIVRDERGDA